MAYSCKANAILAFDYLNTSNNEKTLSPEAAYKYGRDLGIAFQLVDDLLGINLFWVTSFAFKYHK